MCLDFHPDHPNYIAVGFYDGKCKITWSTRLKADLRTFKLTRDTTLAKKFTKLTFMYHGASWIPKRYHVLHTCIPFR